MVAHRLSCHLAARGLAVEVLTRRQPRSLGTVDSIDGIQVTRRRFYPSIRECMGKGRPDLGLVSVLSRSGDERAWRAILKRFKPECVNIHFPDWQVDLIPVIRSMGTARLVVSLHGDEVMRAVRGDARQLSRLSTALREADQVTACSGWLLEKACQLVPEAKGKAQVAWNGIEAGLFAEAEPKPWPRPYVLGFGRFVLKKGFDLLLEAFARLKKGSGLDLVLVGSGPERDTLATRAKELGVAGRVFFPGRAFDDEMIRWIRGARMAVVPSREEPFGIAALEIAAAGVPLVATAVGGMPEFLEPLESEFGLVRLCEPTADSLLVVIQASLDEEYEPGQRAAQIQSVGEAFGWDRRLGVYDSVLGPGKQAGQVR